MKCSTRFVPFSVLLLVATGLRAQAELITEQRVRETVGWLAADERRGRDTGSPELEQAADWLGERFAAAGLQRVAGSFFHEYTLPGSRVDSREIRLELVRKVGPDATKISLTADTDVRLWRPSDAQKGDAEECTVASADDPVLQRMLTASSGRRPIVLEVPEDHSYWQQAAGARNVLGGRRAASRPVFVVRKGVLPPPPEGDKEVAWTANWGVPAAKKVDVPLRNVVALLPGTTQKDEYVVVSAHYDHIGTGVSVDGDDVYNGADDDATGTTAVVLLAEALAKTPMRRSVLFVCFSAEERGLRGSAAFCERPPVPRDRIVANLNLEMLGRPEEGKAGKAWITGPGHSDFAAILTPALATGGVEVIGFPMADNLFSASDNFSFVRHGIVAHSLSAGSLHRDYHRPSDEVELLDIPHMTKVLRALVAAVRELADRDAVPAWNESGKALVGRLKK